MDFFVGLMTALAPLIVIIEIVLIIAAIYNFVNGEVGVGIVLVIIIVLLPIIAAAFFTALIVIVLIFIVIVALLMV